MKIISLQPERYKELKGIFLDVFSNDPWYDKWDDKQLDLYLHELIKNKNSLSLVFIDDEDSIIGGSLGYTFSWWNGREYYIKEFFISREMQNKGLGSIFLSQLNDYLRTMDLRAMWLTTEKTQSAYNFYLKNGFRDLQNYVLLAKSI